MRKTWQAFWNGPQHLQVNPRHAALLGGTIARGLLDAGRARPGQTWLDFGCGEAPGTPALLEAGLNLLLFDDSDRMRALVAERFGGLAGVRVLDPDAYHSLPPESIDLISAISVLQYLTPDEFRATLPGWHRALRPGGILVLGDLIPRRVTPLSDAFALLQCCRRNGYLLSGIRSILATLLSSYGRIRRTAGFTRYDETDLSGLLEPGFEWKRWTPNLGVNQSRMTILATRRHSPRST
jgi:SAM-dependent methyltransferase